MIWIALGFFILSIYLGVRLFLLKKSMRTLAKDFKISRNNLSAEQHVRLSIADRDLEKIAIELNKYVKQYYINQNKYMNEIRQIRNEITNLSHDLRTPLTSILGYLDLLEGENLTPDQNEYLQVIKRRGNTLNDLINQLYDYARLQNNEYPIKCDKMDLYQLVQEELLTYYQEFELHQIEVVISLGEEKKPVWVWADQKCVKRILQNLISNSIKYCGGYLSVIMKKDLNIIKLTFQTKRGNLTDLDVARLFDRFYRKDQNRTDVMGSGLGLTITKILVECMGGSVESVADAEYLYLNCFFKTTDHIETII